jgi:hypothetical protein
MQRLGRIGKTIKVIPQSFHLRFDVFIGSRGDAFLILRSAQIMSGVIQSLASDL